MANADWRSASGAVALTSMHVAATAQVFRYAASYADKVEHAWLRLALFSSRVGAVKPYTGIVRVSYLLGRDPSSSSV